MERRRDLGVELGHRPMHDLPTFVRVAVPALQIARRRVPACDGAMQPPLPFALHRALDGRARLLPPGPSEVEGEELIN